MDRGKSYPQFKNPPNFGRVLCYNKKVHKNILILLGTAGVLVVVVIILAVSSRSGRDGITLTEGNYSPLVSGELKSPRTVGAVTIYPAAKGWRLVENNNLKVSLKVPRDWDINVAASLYDIEATWKNERAVIGADVYSFDNESKITPAQWAEDNALKEFSPISVGGVTGIRYVTKMAVDGEVFDESLGEIGDNSYIVGLALSQGGKMITVKCLITGVDFGLYKSKCDEMINTFNFTK